MLKLNNSSTAQNSKKLETIQMLTERQINIWCISRNAYQTIIKMNDLPLKATLETRVAKKKKAKILNIFVRPQK